MFMRLIVFVVLLIATFQVNAQGPTEVCPVEARVRRETRFEPGGLILTAFDRSGLWVVDIDGRVRYPLDNTRLCGTNCRLSPDATSVTYLDGEEETYRRMTLDGIYRETLYEDTAHDVLYWSPDTLLVYTAGKRAYLQNVNGSRVEIDMSSIISIQPGGLWALALDYRDGVFVRQLLNIALRNAPDSARVRAYFWNPMRLTPPEGDPFEMHLGGVYEHDLVRTDVGWRSRRLVEHLLWRR